MNPRERFLAVLLVVAIALGAGGFLAHQFVYSPWKRENERIAKLREEVSELEDKKLAVQDQQREYETVTRKRSLPADVGLARSEYLRFLEHMLRKAEFASASLTITAREPDTKSAETIAPKKPAYTLLSYDVAVKGDMVSVVDFLHNFYRQPLLHQVRKVTLTKPSTSRGSGRGGRDLDVTFTIDAIVLDRAENRPTLLATIPSVALAAGGPMATAHVRRTLESGAGSPFMAARVLARLGPDSADNGLQSADGSARAKTSEDTSEKSHKEYRRIPSKDIFFGPPPAKKEAEKKEAPRQMDLAPYLGLTRISHAEGWGRAMIFDRYNKEEYEIEVSPKGVVNVSRYLFEKRPENGTTIEVREKFPAAEYDPEFLQFGTKRGGNLRKYLVRRVLESELILEEYDEERMGAMSGPLPAVFGGTAHLALPRPEKVMSWRVGQMLKSEEPGKQPKTFLLTREARQAILRPLEFDGR